MQKEEVYTSFFYAPKLPSKAQYLRHFAKMSVFLWWTHFFYFLVFFPLFLLNVYICVGYTILGSPLVKALKILSFCFLKNAKFRNFIPKSK